MAQKKITAHEMLLSNKNFFGNDEEHEYTIDCYNGYAIGTLTDEEDSNAPKKVYLEYPKRKDVLKDKELAEEILAYRGLYDLTIKDINYCDIMMYMGELVNKNVN